MKKMLMLMIFMIFIGNLLAIYLDWDYIKFPFYHKAISDNYDPYRFKGIEKIEPTFDNKTINYENFSENGIALYPFDCPKEYTTVGRIDISYNGGAEYKTFMAGYTGEYEMWVYSEIDYDAFWTKVINETIKLGANGIMAFKFDTYLCTQDEKVESEFKLLIIRFQGYAIRIDNGTE